MQRLVHLDLKGAPLKISYLEKVKLDQIQVLLSAKSWGATGVLLEWEDTFPYSSDLVCIGSQGGSNGELMYTVEEVKHILYFAKEHGLEVIQLVQTIGHMEFVLKHNTFKGLREAPRSPAVLCPSKQESQILVRAMLEQALESQPEATYFHIGADEVWHSAVCPECQTRAASNKYRKASLFLEHIRDLALFLKEKRPNLTILMWDDMLRSLDVDTLKAYSLGDLVQPVVWDYNKVEYFRLSPGLWDTYRRTFPKVWAASAFKGANGSCQILPLVPRYVSNHEAWRVEIEKYKGQVDFAGIILTGWSRYDHYATLCELMPSSLPSLASCLRCLTEATPSETFISNSLPTNEWPGAEIAHRILYFTMLKDRCLAFLQGDQIMTWLNPWQIERNYTSATQIEGTIGTADGYVSFCAYCSPALCDVLIGRSKNLEDLLKGLVWGSSKGNLLSELAMVQNDLISHLYAITGPRSADEWIGTNVTPVAKRLVEIREIASARSNVDAGITPLC